MDGRRLIVDPMLDPAGARGPVRGTPRERPNPVVGLPVAAPESVAGVEALLLTHTHVDHLDAAAVETLPAGLPSFCQPEDAADLAPLGFGDLRPIPGGGAVEWRGLRISRTGGRHGREEAMVAGLGPVSGFVVEAAGEPTVSMAGDTVWCDEVATAVAEHRPEWIVVNAGGARFLQGGAITMEAINHCLETRAELRAALDDAGVSDRVAIPADGETLDS